MILSLEGDMENATGGDFFYTHIYRIIKATNPKTGWPNRIIPIVRFWDLELVYRYLIRKNLFPIAIYIYIYPFILNIPFEVMLLVIKVIKLLPMKFFLWLYFITLELPGALFPCLLWFFHSLKIWIFYDTTTADIRLIDNYEELNIILIQQSSVWYILLIVYTYLSFKLSFLWPLPLHFNGTWQYDTTSLVDIFSIWLQEHIFWLHNVLMELINTIYL